MTIAQLIRKIRRDRHLTQEEFADAIGRSRSAIAAWESGTKEPGREALKLIGKAFDLPLSYLLGEKRGDNVVICNEPEITLLKLFRSADEATRQFVLHALKVTQKGKQ